MITLKDFIAMIIQRSDYITTCFFIDESTDDQFEEYYKQYCKSQDLDAVIWSAVADAYDLSDEE